MKFEIDVDLPEDVLKEWEPVAIRVAAIGEPVLWLDPVRVGPATYSSPNPRMVLRRRFQWPAWLKCRYLVWDEDGTASGWNEMPELSSVDWSNENSPANKLEFVASPQHATRFGVSFPGGDWRTRIEENPNWEKTDVA